MTFASLLIAQQGSIFVGLMSFTISQIKDIGGADIWVMDRNVQFIDDIKPLSDNDLYRIRGVKGVDWAVRLYKGIERGRLADGNFQQMILIGLDDATLVGAPQDITLGNLEDLRRPEAVFMDENGFKQLWPNEPFRLGKRFEMNDRQATIVGIFKARRTFQTFPVVYTRYTQATSFAPSERKVLSFVLADPEPGLSAEEVCRRINAQTNLLALTREQFSQKTIIYFLKNTGIPMNFGITVLLGLHRGHGDRRADVLSVHAGKSQAIRGPQSDGGQQPDADADGAVASRGGGLDRLWAGGGRCGTVWRADQVAVEAGVPDALVDPGRHGGGRAGDFHAGQPVVDPETDRAGTGHCVPRITSAWLEDVV